MALSLRPRCKLMSATIIRLDNWQDLAFCHWAEPYWEVVNAWGLSSPKRQQAFLAGRYCAMQALEMHELVVHGLLARQKDRTVAWPTSFVGSISHTQGHAVAMVAPKTVCHSVGIDVEPWIDPAKIDHLRLRVLGLDERCWLSGSTQYQAERLTILFSAKETLYKLLYPDVLHHMPFLAVRVTQFDDERLILTLTVDWCERFLAGQRFEVRYWRHAWGVETQALIMANEVNLFS